MPILALCSVGGQIALKGELLEPVAAAEEASRF